MQIKIIKKMSSIKLIFLFKKKEISINKRRIRISKKSNDILFTETSAKTGSNINAYLFFFIWKIVFCNQCMLNY